GGPRARSTCEQILEEHRLQTLAVNASIFGRFIRAGRFALQKRRGRQLCKWLGLRLRDEGINGVEQGIFSSQGTSIDILTKRLQCAKIHVSKAPSAFFLNFTLPG